MPLSSSIGLWDSCVTKVFVSSLVEDGSFAHCGSDFKYEKENKIYFYMSKVSFMYLV